MASLTSQFPDLRKHLFADDGKLRRFVNVYVNDEDIRYLQNENTPRPGERHGFDRAIGGGGIVAGVSEPVDVTIALSRGSMSPSIARWQQA